ncbi:MAG: tetratricopeptide repeat protein [Endomicrobiales bacterium]|nr:tetratricopeptide repeat protein [Endomicrobiales bacterium]
MNIKKFIAVLTTCCFVFSFIVSQPLQAVVEKRKETAEFREIFDSFFIPGVIGRITEVRDSRQRAQTDLVDESQASGAGRCKRVVVNIQDLHCHPEVQRNISKILSILDKKYDLKNVYIEGASGNIDTSWLTDVDDKELKDKVLEALIDSGKLTGAEYYSVKSGKTDLLVGVENRKLHTDNILRLKTINEKQKQINSEIEFLNEDLVQLEQRYFNSRNKKLTKTIEKHKEGNLKPHKYYSDLLAQAGKLGVDVDKYQNIIEFSKTFEISGKMKYKKVGQELQSFLNLLKQKLPYNAFNMLANYTSNFTQPNLLYVYLSKIVKVYNLDIQDNYPNLKQFFKYLETSQNLNPLELIREEQRLLNEIRIRLALSQSERDVIFLIEFTKYLKDYLSYKISADDYEYVRNNLSDYELLWAKYIGNDKLAGITPHIELLNEYYGVNIKRNECILSNCKIEDRVQGIEDRTQLTETAKPEDAVDAKMENSISALLNNAEEIVVLITGGFHTPGLCELMRERSVPYLVITPNVTQETGFAEDVYSELLLKQGEFLSEALALQSLTELVNSADASAAQKIGGATEFAETALTRVEGLKEMLLAGDVAGVNAKFWEYFPLEGELTHDKPKLFFEGRKRNGTFPINVLCLDKDGEEITSTVYFDPATGKITKAEQGKEIVASIIESQVQSNEPILDKVKGILERLVVRIDDKKQECIDLCLEIEAELDNLDDSAVQKELEAKMNTLISIYQEFLELGNQAMNSFLVLPEGDEMRNEMITWINDFAGNNLGGPIGILRRCRDRLDRGSSQRENIAGFIDLVVREHSFDALEAKIDKVFGMIEQYSSNAQAAENGQLLNISQNRFEYLKDKKGKEGLTGWETIEYRVVHPVIGAPIIETFALTIGTLVASFIDPTGIIAPLLIGWIFAVLHPDVRANIRAVMAEKGWTGILGWIRAAFSADVLASRGFWQRFAFGFGSSLFIANSIMVGALLSWAVHAYLNLHKYRGWRGSENIEYLQWWYGGMEVYEYDSNQIREIMKKLNRSGKRAFVIELMKSIASGRRTRVPAQNMHGLLSQWIEELGSYKPDFRGKIKQAQAALDNGDVYKAMEIIRDLEIDLYYERAVPASLGAQQQQDLEAWESAIAQLIVESEAFSKPEEYPELQNLEVGKRKKQVPAVLEKIRRALRDRVNAIPNISDVQKKRLGLIFAKIDQIQSNIDRINIGDAILPLDKEIGKLRDLVQLMYSYKVPRRMRMQIHFLVECLATQRRTLVDSLRLGEWEVPPLDDYQGLLQLHRRCQAAINSAFYNSNKIAEAEALYAKIAASTPKEAAIPGHTRFLNVLKELRRSQLDEIHELTRKAEQKEEEAEMVSATVDVNGQRVTLSPYATEVLRSRPGATLMNNETISWLKNRFVLRFLFGDLGNIVSNYYANAGLSRGQWFILGLAVRIAAIKESGQITTMLGFSPVLDSVKNLTLNAVNLLPTINNKQVADFHRGHRLSDIYRQEREIGLDEINRAMIMAATRSGIWGGLLFWMPTKTAIWVANVVTHMRFNMQSLNMARNMAIPLLMQTPTSFMIEPGIDASIPEGTAGHIWLGSASQRSVLEYRHTDDGLEIRYVDPNTGQEFTTTVVAGDESIPFSIVGSVGVREKETSLEFSSSGGMQILSIPNSSLSTISEASIIYSNGKFVITNKSRVEQGKNIALRAVPSLLMMDRNQQLDAYASQIIDFVEKGYDLARIPVLRGVIDDIEKLLDTRTVLHGRSEEIEFLLQAIEKKWKIKNIIKTDVPAFFEPIQMAEITSRMDLYFNPWYIEYLAEAEERRDELDNAKLAQRLYIVLRGLYLRSEEGAIKTRNTRIRNYTLHDETFYELSVHVNVNGMSLEIPITAGYTEQELAQFKKLGYEVNRFLAGVSDRDRPLAILFLIQQMDTILIKDILDPTADYFASLFAQCNLTEITGALETFSEKWKNLLEHLFGSIPNEPEQKYKQAAPKAKEQDPKMDAYKKLEKYLSSYSSNELAVDLTELGRVIRIIQDALSRDSYPEGITFNAEMLVKIAQVIQAVVAQKPQSITYTILNSVNPQMTKKKVYRKLVRYFHTDINQASFAKEATQLVNAVYEPYRNERLTTQANIKAYVILQYGQAKWDSWDELDPKERERLEKEASERYAPSAEMGDLEKIFDELGNVSAVVAAKSIGRNSYAELNRFLNAHKPEGMDDAEWANKRLRLASGIDIIHRVLVETASLNSVNVFALFRVARDISKAILQEETVIKQNRILLIIKIIVNTLRGLRLVNLNLSDLNAQQLANICAHTAFNMTYDSRELIPEKPVAVISFDWDTILDEFLDPKKFPVELRANKSKFMAFLDYCSENNILVTITPYCFLDDIEEALDKEILERILVVETPTGVSKNVSLSALERVGTECPGIHIDGASDSVPLFNILSRRQGSNLSAITMSPSTIDQLLERAKLEIGQKVELEASAAVLGVDDRHVAPDVFFRPIRVGSGVGVPILTRGTLREYVLLKYGRSLEELEPEELEIYAKEAAERFAPVAELDDVTAALADYIANGENGEVFQEFLSRHSPESDRDALTRGMIFIQTSINIAGELTFTDCKTARDKAIKVARAIIEDKEVLPEAERKALKGLNPTDLADLVLTSIDEWLQFTNPAAAAKGLTIDQLANIIAHAAWNLTHDPEERLFVSQDAADTLAERLRKLVDGGTLSIEDVEDYVEMYLDPTLRDMLDELDETLDDDKPLILIHDLVGGLGLSVGESLKVLPRVLEGLKGSDAGVMPVDISSSLDTAFIADVDSLIGRLSDLDLERLTINDIAIILRVLISPLAEGLDDGNKAKSIRDFLESLGVSIEGTRPNHRPEIVYLLERLESVDVANLQSQVVADALEEVTKTRAELLVNVSRVRSFIILIQIDPLRALRIIEESGELSGMIKMHLSNADILAKFKRALSYFDGDQENLELVNRIVTLLGFDQGLEQVALTGKRDGTEHTAPVQDEGSEINALRQRLAETGYKDVAALVDLANIYLGQQNYGSAEYVLKRLTEAAPDRIDAWSALGDCYSNLGSYDDGIECYEEAVRLSNEQSPEQKDISLLSRLGLLCLRRGTERYYRRAAEVYKELTIILPREAAVWFNLGYAYERIRNYKAALEFYSQALRLNPNNSEAYYRSGVVSYELADLAGTSETDRSRYLTNAEMFFTVALEQNPNHINALEELDRVYSRTGETDKRIEVIERLIAANPQEAGYHNALGTCYKSYDPGEALKHFRRAALLNPQLDVVWANIGDIYYELARIAGEVFRNYELAAIYKSQEHRAKLAQNRALGKVTIVSPETILAEIDSLKTLPRFLEELRQEGGNEMAVQYLRLQIYQPEIARMIRNLVKNREQTGETESLLSRLAEQDGLQVMTRELIRAITDLDDQLFIDLTELNTAPPDHMVTLKNAGVELTTSQIDEWLAQMDEWLKRHPVAPQSGDTLVATAVDSEQLMLPITERMGQWIAGKLGLDEEGTFVTVIFPAIVEFLGFLVPEVFHELHRGEGTDTTSRIVAKSLIAGTWIIFQGVTSWALMAAGISPVNLIMFNMIILCKRSLILVLSGDYDEAQRKRARGILAVNFWTLLVGGIVAGLSGNLGLALGAMYLANAVRHGIHNLVTPDARLFFGKGGASPASKLVKAGYLEKTRSDIGQDKFQPTKKLLNLIGNGIGLGVIEIGKEVYLVKVREGMLRGFSISAIFYQNKQEEYTFGVYRTTYEFSPEEVFNRVMGVVVAQSDYSRIDFNLGNVLEDDVIQESKEITAEKVREAIDRKVYSFDRETFDEVADDNLIDMIVVVVNALKGNKVNTQGFPLLKANVVEAAKAKPSGMAESAEAIELGEILGRAGDLDDIAVVEELISNGFLEVETIIEDTLFKGRRIEHNVVPTQKLKDIIGAGRLVDRGEVTVTVEKQTYTFKFDKGHVVEITARRRTISTSGYTEEFARQEKERKRQEIENRVVGEGVQGIRDLLEQGGVIIARWPSVADVVSGDFSVSILIDRPLSSDAVQRLLSYACVESYPDGIPSKYQGTPTEKVINFAWAVLREYQQPIAEYQGRPIRFFSDLFEVLRFDERFHVNFRYPNLMEFDEDSTIWGERKHGEKTSDIPSILLQEEVNLLLTIMQREVSADDVISQRMKLFARRLLEYYEGRLNKLSGRQVYEAVRIGLGETVDSDVGLQRICKGIRESQLQEVDAGLINEVQDIIRERTQAEHTAIVQALEGETVELKAGINKGLRVKVEVKKVPGDTFTRKNETAPGVSMVNFRATEDGLVLSIDLLEGFLDSASPNAIAQAIAYPLLIHIAGLSTQEAVLVENLYNEDRTRDTFLSDLDLYTINRARETGNEAVLRTILRAATGKYPVIYDSIPLGQISPAESPIAYIWRAAVSPNEVRTGMDLSLNDLTGNRVYAAGELAGDYLVDLVERNARESMVSRLIRILTATIEGGRHGGAVTAQRTVTVTHDRFVPVILEKFGIQQEGRMQAAMDHAVSAGITGFHGELVRTVLEGVDLFAFKDKYFVNYDVKVEGTDGDKYHLLEDFKDFVDLAIHFADEIATFNPSIKRVRFFMDRESDEWMLEISGPKAAYYSVLRGEKGMSRPEAETPLDPDLLGTFTISRKAFMQDANRQAFLDAIEANDVDSIGTPEAGALSSIVEPETEESAMSDVAKQIIATRDDTLREDELQDLDTNEFAKVATNLIEKGVLIVRENRVTYPSKLGSYLTWHRDSTGDITVQLEGAGYKIFLDANGDFANIQRYAQPLERRSNRTEWLNADDPGELSQVGLGAQLATPATLREYVMMEYGRLLKRFKPETKAQRQKSLQVLGMVRYLSAMMAERFNEETSAEFMAQRETKEEELVNLVFELSKALFEFANLQAGRNEYPLPTESDKAMIREGIANLFTEDPIELQINLPGRRHWLYIDLAYIDEEGSVRLEIISPELKPETDPILRAFRAIVDNKKLAQITVTKEQAAKLDAKELGRIRKEASVRFAPLAELDEVTAALADYAQNGEQGEIFQAFLSKHSPKSDKAALTRGMIFIQTSMNIAGDLLGKLTPLDSENAREIAIRVARAVIEDRDDLSELERDALEGLNPEDLADLVLASIDEWLSFTNPAIAAKGLTVEQLANIIAHTAWNITHNPNEWLLTADPFPLSPEYVSYDITNTDQVMQNLDKILLIPDKLVYLDVLQDRLSKKPTYIVPQVQGVVARYRMQLISISQFQRGILTEFGKLKAADGINYLQGVLEILLKGKTDKLKLGRKEIKAIQEFGQRTDEQFLKDVIEWLYLLTIEEELELEFENEERRGKGRTNKEKAQPLVRFLLATTSEDKLKAFLPEEAEYINAAHLRERLGQWILFLICQNYGLDLEGKSNVERLALLRNLMKRPQLNREILEFFPEDIRQDKALREGMVVLIFNVYERWVNTYQARIERKGGVLRSLDRRTGLPGSVSYQESLQNYQQAYESAGADQTAKDAAWKQFKKEIGTVAPLKETGLLAILALVPAGLLGVLALFVLPLGISTIALIGISAITGLFSWVVLSAIFMTWHKGTLGAEYDSKKGKFYRLGLLINFPFLALFLAPLAIPFVASYGLAAAIGIYLMYTLLAGAGSFGLHKYYNDSFLEYVDKHKLGKDGVVEFTDKINSAPPTVQLWLRNTERPASSEPGVGATLIASAFLTALLVGILIIGGLLVPKQEPSPQISPMETPSSSEDSMTRQGIPISEDGTTGEIEKKGEKEVDIEVPPAEMPEEEPGLPELINVGDTVEVNDLPQVREVLSNTFQALNCNTIHYTGELPDTEPIGNKDGQEGEYYEGDVDRIIEDFAKRGADTSPNAYPKYLIELKLHEHSSGKYLVEFGFKLRNPSFFSQLSETHRKLMAYGVVGFMFFLGLAWLARKLRGKRHLIGAIFLFLFIGGYSLVAIVDIIKTQGIRNITQVSVDSDTDLAEPAKRRRGVIDYERERVKAEVPPKDKIETGSEEYPGPIVDILNAFGMDTPFKRFIVGAVCSVPVILVGVILFYLIWCSGSTREYGTGNPWFRPGQWNRGGQYVRRSNIRGSRGVARVLFAGFIGLLVTVIGLVAIIALLSTAGVSIGMISQATGVINTLTKILIGSIVALGIFTGIGMVFAILSSKWLFERFSISADGKGVTGKSGSFVTTIGVLLILPALITLVLVGYIYPESYSWILTPSMKAKLGLAEPASPLVPVEQPESSMEGGKKAVAKEELLPEKGTTEKLPPEPAQESSQEAEPAAPPESTPIPESEPAPVSAGLNIAQVDQGLSALETQGVRFFMIFTEGYQSNPNQGLQNNSGVRGAELANLAQDGAYRVWRYRADLAGFEFGLITDADTTPEEIQAWFGDIRITQVSDGTTSSRQSKVPGRAKMLSPEMVQVSNLSNEEKSEQFRRWLAYVRAQIASVSSSGEGMLTQAQLAIQEERARLYVRAANLYGELSDIQEALSAPKKTIKPRRSLSASVTKVTHATPAQIVKDVPSTLPSVVDVPEIAVGMTLDEANAIVSRANRLMMSDKGHQVNRSELAEAREVIKAHAKERKPGAPRLAVSADEMDELRDRQLEILESLAALDAELMELHRMDEYQRLGWVQKFFLWLIGRSAGQSFNLPALTRLTFPVLASYQRFSVFGELGYGLSNAKTWTAAAYGGIVSGVITMLTVGVIAGAGIFNIGAIIALLTVGLGGAIVGGFLGVGIFVVGIYGPLTFPVVAAALGRGETEDRSEHFKAKLESVQKILKEKNPNIEVTATSERLGFLTPAETKTLTGSTEGEGNIIISHVIYLNEKLMSRLPEWLQDTIIEHELAHALELGHEDIIPMDVRSIIERGPVSRLSGPVWNAYKDSIRTFFPHKLAKNMVMDLFDRYTEIRTDYPDAERTTSVVFTYGGENEEKLTEQDVDLTKAGINRIRFAVTTESELDAREDVVELTAGADRVPYIVAEIDGNPVNFRIFAETIDAGNGTFAVKLHIAVPDKLSERFADLGVMKNLYYVLCYQIVTHSVEAGKSFNEILVDLGLPVKGTKKPLNIDSIYTGMNPAIAGELRVEINDIRFPDIEKAVDHLGVMGTMVFSGYAPQQIVADFRAKVLGFVKRIKSAHSRCSGFTMSLYRELGPGTLERDRNWGRVERSISDIRGQFEALLNEAREIQAFAPDISVLFKMAGIKRIEKVLARIDEFEAYGREQKKLRAHEFGGMILSNLLSLYAGLEKDVQSSLDNEALNKQLKASDRISQTVPIDATSEEFLETYAGAKTTQVRNQSAVTTGKSDVVMDFDMNILMSADRRVRRIRSVDQLYGYAQKALGIWQGQAGEVRFKDMFNADMSINEEYLAERVSLRGAQKDAFENYVEKVSDDLKSYVKHQALALTRRQRELDDTIDDESVMRSYNNDYENNAMRVYYTFWMLEQVRSMPQVDGISLGISVSDHKDARSLYSSIKVAMALGFTGVDVYLSGDILVTDINVFLNDYQVQNETARQQEKASVPEEYVTLFIYNAEAYSDGEIAQSMNDLGIIRHQTKTLGESFGVVDENASVEFTLPTLEDIRRTGLKKDELMRYLNNAIGVDAKRKIMRVDIPESDIFERLRVTIQEFGETVSKAIALLPDRKTRPARMRAQGQRYFHGRNVPSVEAVQDLMEFVSMYVIRPSDYEVSVRRTARELRTAIEGIKFGKGFEVDEKRFKQDMNRFLEIIENSDDKAKQSETLSDIMNYLHGICLGMIEHRYVTMENRNFETDQVRQAYVILCFNLLALDGDKLGGNLDDLSMYDTSVKYSRRLKMEARDSICGSIVESGVIPPAVYDGIAGRKRNAIAALISNLRDFETIPLIELQNIIETLQQPTRAGLLQAIEAAG